MRDHPHMAAEWAYAGLVGVVAGTVITAGGAWIGGNRQRMKEHLAVRKTTYSAYATALMTHYAALQSLKNDVSVLGPGESLAPGRFSQVSELYLSVMQSLGAVIVEGPSQTIRFARRAALALEGSTEELRGWIESGASEEESVNLDGVDGRIRLFMRSARHSLRHTPHDEELDVGWRTRAVNWLNRKIGA
jgi:hypothetical protein